jgi:carbamoyltransferase
MGFAELFSECARALGFTTNGREQRMEALARLDPTHHEDWATQLFDLEDERVRTAADWQAQIERWSGGCERRQHTAAALQSRIVELVVDFLARLKQRVPLRRRLCLGGSLFYNSYLNSEIRRAGVYDQVFVPVDTGNSGLSTGVALHATGLRQPVTPFLGPVYDSEEIKATLDNCKLTYQCVSESDTIAITVDALRKGHLVAWFDGAMEWGPRALGARSIFANPFGPYVLDNLNRFLKHRDVWRGYALSVLESAVGEHFEGPGSSPFMECDYSPRDRGRFQQILPGPRAAVRVHTVAAYTSLPRFWTLLDEFGRATGLPAVVNTSFNGLLEPIVCSPRDAIRVFFGTGVDMLVLGRFVLTK